MRKTRAFVEDFDRLKSMSADLKAQGRPLRFAIVRGALISLLFIVAALLHSELHKIAISIASIAGISLVWWIHDSGHDAYFEKRTDSKNWIEALGILFLGMPQIEYHYEVHRKHHGSTNVIDRDGALNTGPIIWHEGMISEKRRGLGKFQGLVWIFFVLPLTWPLINVRCIQTIIERKNRWRVVLLTARWIALPVLLNYDWAFLLIPILITGFVLGFASSLNHFHMPISVKSPAPFPKSVFITTQNLSHRDEFTTWLTGGLNFHVEHHLFPDLPHHQLRVMAPHVEAFANKHGLPYQICSGRQAVGRLWSRLQNPQTFQSDEKKA